MTNALDQDYCILDEGLQFTPPMRVHHLTGGLSLLIASNKLAMLMPTEKGMTFFSLVQNASVTAILNGQDELRHLGTNYFDKADELHAPVTQEFSISAPAQNGGCLARAQCIEWHGVANALHQLKRGADALTATRIASEVRACLGRLERLSMAYRTVLMEVRTSQRSPSPSRFTNDKYAAYLSIEFRAMLNDLYALRDAVLAGTFRFRFKRSDPFQMRKIKSLASKETDGAAGLISRSMFADDGDRLIDHMALYRSVAQHCLGATNPILDNVYQLLLSTGPLGDLPYITFPLYDDIERMREIERGSSDGVLERPPGEEVERFGRLGRYTDALHFCYDCFVRLLEISQLLRLETGIDPRPVTLTENEILELVLTDSAGNVTRARRDETGRLVEY